MTAPIPPLFGGPIRSNVGTPAALNTGPLHLVEFRAGRMTLRDRMVTPDRRKGLLYVFQSDDGLAHFCWKDRTSGAVEEDLILFPDDVTFEKLSAEKMGGRGGRVFLLRFKANPSRKFFFWSQEPRTEVDDTICERVLEAINNPTHVLASLMASRGGSADGASGRGADNLFPPGAVSPGGAFTEADLQALLGAYSPQQLLSWMNSGANSRPTSAGATPFGIGAAGSNMPPPAAPSTLPPTSTVPPTTNEATTTQPASSSSQPPSTPSTTTALNNANGAPRRPGAADLAAALRAIGATMANQGKSGSSASGGTSVPLSDVLSADAVIPSATVPGAADRLIANLPGTGLPGDEELIASLRSPQFQQAASMLQAALETGQLGPLLIEMGVARDAVAGVHDVESFLRALQQHTSSVPTTANGNTNGTSKASSKKSEQPDGQEQQQQQQQQQPTADTNGGSEKNDTNNGGDAGNGASPMEH